MQDKASFDKDNKVTVINLSCYVAGVGFGLTWDHFVVVVVVGCKLQSNSIFAVRAEYSAIVLVKCSLGLLLFLVVIQQNSIDDAL